MIRMSAFSAIAVGAVLCAAITAAPATETPKRGGILTYMIPADAPPSLDGNRETTFATVQGARDNAEHPPAAARAQRGRVAGRPQLDPPGPGGRGLRAGRGREDLAP